jgi:hypothetical protein
VRSLRDVVAKIDAPENVLKTLDSRNAIAIMRGVETTPSYAAVVAGGRILPTKAVTNLFGKVQMSLGGKQNGQDLLDRAQVQLRFENGDHARSTQVFEVINHAFRSLGFRPTTKKKQTSG